jgi:hypothetical protein
MAKREGQLHGKSSDWKLQFSSVKRRYRSIVYRLYERLRSETNGSPSLLKQLPSDLWSHKYSISESMSDRLSEGSWRPGGCARRCQSSDTNLPRFAMLEMPHHDIRLRKEGIGLELSNQTLMIRVENCSRRGRNDATSTSATIAGGAAPQCALNSPATEAFCWIKTT